MDTENADVRKSGEPNAAIIYMVSIYLLLIAFFVILHTISKKEEVRTAAVVGSLNMTFVRPDDRTEDLPSMSGRPQLAGPNREFRDRVESVFGAFLDTARFSQEKDGNVLRVTMPADSLFYTGTATLRADRIGLIREIAGMVANPRPYRRNSIEVGFHAGLSGRDAPPLDKRIEIRRAGALAQDLSRHDIDPALVTVGVLEGAADTMQITFTSRSRSDGDDGRR